MSIYYMENIDCSSHAGFKAFRGVPFWGLGFRVGGFPTLGTFLGAPIRGSLVFGGYCGSPIMETTTCWSGVGAQVKLRRSCSIGQSSLAVCSES